MFGFSQSTIQIGTGTQSTSLPVYGVWEYGWSSSIYPAQSIIGTNSITHLSFDCNNGPRTANNQKIYLKLSTAAVFADASYENPESNGYTKVFDGNISFVNGWNQIDITDFVYDGTSNIIVHWENRDGTFNYNNPNFNSTTSVTNNTKVNGEAAGFPTSSGYLNPYPNSLPNIILRYVSAGTSNPSIPTPAANETKVLVDSDLSFNLDDLATNYDVYFSTDENLVSTMDNSVKIVSDATASEGLNTVNFAQLNGGNFLNSKTEYFWKVVAKDGSGSAESTVWTFTTQVFLTAFPYNQGFEEGNPAEVVFHPGYYGFDVDWDYPASPNNWNYNDGGDYQHSGLICAYISPSFFATGNEFSLTSPRFDLSDANYQISFFWMNMSPYKSGKISDADKTFFEISTNGGTDWTTLKELYPTSEMTDYTQEIVDLSAFTSNNVLFRWRYQVINTAYTPLPVYLDDIRIETISTSPQISINPENHFFGEIYLGGYTTFDVEITNTHATLPLVITGVTPSGPFSSSFSGTIPASGSAVATIVYTPTGAGTNNGSIVFNIQDNEFLGNNVVTLSGTGMTNASELYEYFETTAQDELPTHWNCITNYPSDLYHFAIVESANAGEYHSAYNVLRLYNNSNIVSPLIAILPGVTNFATHTLKFYAIAGISGEQLEVGLMTNPHDPASFQLIQSVSPPQEATAPFSVTFATDNIKPYIAFRHGLHSSNSSIRIDDVEWVNISGETVPNPAQLVGPAEASLENDIMNDLLLKWSNGGGEPTGYRLSVGTSLGNITNVINNIDLGVITSQLISNLQFNTTYFWKIVPYNAQGDAVDCPVWSFTTMTDPTITIYPWSDSFETVTQHYLGTYDFYYPMGWSLENNQEAGFSWDKISNSPSYTNNAHTGTQAMNLVSGFSFLNPMDDWFFTPPLNMQANHDYELRFWYKIAVLEGSSEKMEVKIGDDNASAAMTGTTLFYDDNITLTDYTEHVQTFSPAVNGINFIGFHGFSNPYQWILFLDDVTINDLGINSVENIESDFSVYPNPAESVIHFSSPEIENSKQIVVTIYSLTGQIVQKKIGTADISISELTSGLYILDISTLNKHFRTRFSKK